MTNKLLLTPLHAGPEWSVELILLVTAAAVGTALLLGLAFAAFLQRRSRSYVLIVAAIGALLGRSLIAGATVIGVFSQATHHLLEHAVDVVLVALVVGAVYYARSVSQEAEAI